MFHVAVLILLLILQHCNSFGGTNWLQSARPRRHPLASSTLSPPAVTTTTSGTNNGPALTQKELFIALRNRLYVVDEQIWLHKYAKAHRGDKLQPLSEEKFAEFQRLRQQLVEEYPLTKLYSDYHEAQKFNLTFARFALEGMISQLQRQLPMPLTHLNQVAVTSQRGDVVHLLHPREGIYQQLLSSNHYTPHQMRRQFQYPVFSNSGNYIAYLEVFFDMAASSSPAMPAKEFYAKSHVLVFDVDNDPKRFGNTDITPVYDSGPLVGEAPFWLRFSADDSQLVLLSADVNRSSPTYGDSVLSELDWKSSYGNDITVQERIKKIRADPLQNHRLSSLLGTKKRDLLQGNSLFASLTTSSSRNATMVAHVQNKLPVDGGTKEESRNGVFVRNKVRRGGKTVELWRPISKDRNEKNNTTGREKVRWSTPQCHSAGGGDSVVMVEDGYLVTKPLSRYKRFAMLSEHNQPRSEQDLLVRNTKLEDSFPSKVLKAVRGQVQFVVSPDHSRMAVLEEDLVAGHYSMVVVDGEHFLDPLNKAVPTLPSPPTSIGDRIIRAFWFSPDSTKLLCLATAKERLSEAADKGLLAVSPNAPMTWCVYNIPLQEWREYDTFQPTSYFMKSYVPLFSVHAQTFNPWAPDSKSFIYTTETGLCHTPLLVSDADPSVSAKQCLGVDRWQNNGAIFGTWSRH